jgi:hypothetical protein
VRVKVVASADKEIPERTFKVACPACGAEEMIEGHEILSIVVDEETTTPAMPG